MAVNKIAAALSIVGFAGFYGFAATHEYPCPAPIPFVAVVFGYAWILGGLALALVQFLGERSEPR